MRLKIKPYIVSALAAISLSIIAHVRTDFCLDVVQAPMIEEGREAKSSEIEQALKQPFVFFGKGRQSFAFVSEDGKTVLKFFNRKYFEMPWYSFALWDQAKEAEKRERRAFFYFHSYLIAEKFLQQETGILYLHMGKTAALPKVKIQDRTGRMFEVDLNLFPFVLQKRGEPLYDALSRIQRAQGNEALFSALCDFLQIIALRISLGIADQDHDVEHNFGFLNGKPLHLDPGRLFLSSFSDTSRKGREWWSATHALRKWLVEQYPDVVTSFDQRLNELAGDIVAFENNCNLYNF